MMRARHAAVLAGLLAVLSSPGAAQETRRGWYAGIGVSGLYTRYNPHYLTYADDDRESFLNKADGVQAEVLLGWRLATSGRLSFSVQAAAMANNFDWSLSIPSEPADFEYSMPWAAMLTVLPEIRLADRVSLVAEAGGGVGRVHLVKTSSAASAYDVDRVGAALSLGGGFQVRLSSRFDLLARYRFLAYSAHDWDSHSPTGATIEHVSDAQHSSAVTLGVVRRF